jgi:hypothetical protein
MPEPKPPFKLVDSRFDRASRKRKSARVEKDRMDILKGMVEMQDRIKEALIE